MKNRNNRPGKTIEQRQRAEEITRKKAAQSLEDLEVLSPEEIRKKLHELQVHQIEFEIQNEELRRTLKELDTVRARYFDLYDLAPVGNVTVGEKGLILEANLTIATMLGMSWSAVVKQPLSRFIIPEDQDIYYLNRKQLFNTAEPLVCELRMLRYDGTQFWALMNMTIAPDANGALACRSTISDITESKRIEVTLKERIKELGCLYSISNLMELSNISLDEILKKIVILIPPAWQFPDITVARITLEGQLFQTKDFRETTWMQVREIMVYGRPIGQVEVYYLEERPVCDEGPFMIEEWHLLNAIAERLGHIIERKRAEETVRESEARYQRTVNGANDGIWEWNLPTGEDYLSPRWKQLLGYEDHELPNVEAGFFDQIHPEDQPLVLEAIRGHCEERKPFEIELRLRCKSGQYRWFSSRGKAQWDEQGRPLLMSGSISDITERKQSEMALRESEAQYREEKYKLQKFFDVTGVILLAIDADQKVVLINKKGCEVLGYNHEEIIGKNWFDNFLPERIREKVMEVFNKFVAGEVNDVEYFENPVLTKSGEERLIAWHNTALCDKKGKFIHSVVSGEDITELKRAKKEKKMLQAQFNQAQKMESVGRLAGGVAHDYNNMLCVIQGYANLALEKLGPSEPLYSDLQQILAAAKRSTDITRQLLAFARKQIIEPRILDLNETVEGMLKMLRRLIGEDVKLTWRPKANLWPVKIDPSQLDQILANLCINSRDAITDIGKIFIETENFAFDEAYCADHGGVVPGEFVLLAVSDNGCGMEKETLEQIFEPFFTTKEIGKGTGLGMSTVYGIVKQNNGFIKIYSESGKGTTVKIYLPRHVGQAVATKTAITTKIPKGRGETVILVEDETTILVMITKMLERQGYLVLAANTMAEAIRLAEEHADEIRLLITDVVMPEMNGLELSERLKVFCPKLKCLFMSGYTANVIAHHGLLDEGVQFIQKPFSKEDLVTKVRAAIDQK